MKQLTKKQFWTGICGVGFVGSFAYLCMYVGANQEKALTADEVMYSVLLLCSTVVFGNFFINHLLRD